MNIESVSNLVTNLGFPIVCVVACAYFINYIIKAEREENQKREDKYMETINNFSSVMEKLNESINNNSKRLEYIENKLDEICVELDKQ